MNKSYLFISDIHLGLQSPEIENKKERLLEKFLNDSAGIADELFIVGDLFDYWFEYKKVYQKGFFRTLTALQDLTDARFKVHYLIGNHDFMHGNFFRDVIGVNLYEESLTAELNGRKFFIAHGDGLVKNDTGYNILKKILRNKTLQKLYALLHPDIGVALGSKTSKSSRTYTSRKDYGEVDGLFEAAQKKIDEGFDYVLFGHLHKRCFEKYKSGYYVNLGSWLDAPCYGIFQNDKFKIIELSLEKQE